MEGQTVIEWVCPSKAKSRSPGDQDACLPTLEMFGGIEEICHYQVPDYRQEGVLDTSEARD